VKGIDADPQVPGWRPDVAALQVPKKQDKSRRREKSGPSFLNLLEDEPEPMSANEAFAATGGNAMLESAVDDIHHLGEKLARHPGPETIQAYKQALKKVIEAFVQSGLVSEKHTSNRNVLQQKSYQLIRVIDEKLERLVVGILQSQVTQIDILAKIEEIQGLLVNLLF